MTKRERLIKAINDVDEKYIVEANEYNGISSRGKIVKYLATAAAMFVLCLVVVNFIGRFTPDNNERKEQSAGTKADVTQAITVYAAEGDKKIGRSSSTIVTGRIDDSGQMNKQNLILYVSGKQIKQIRYSCKNEKMMFEDTANNVFYGLSRNFTVDYSGRNDYKQLLLEWQADHMIKYISERKNIRDIPEKRRSDIIVMQVTYEDGSEQTYAVNIRMNDDGRFEAEFSKYQIRESDTFINGADKKPEKLVEDKDSDKIIAPDSNSSLNEKLMVCAKNYYRSLDYVVDYDSITRITDKSIIHEWNDIAEANGYSEDEIAVFVIDGKNLPAKRQMVIGFRDNGNHCKVLTEGF